MANLREGLHAFLHASRAQKGLPIIPHTKSPDCT
jgi:hypothetical protein